MEQIDISDNLGCSGLPTKRPLGRQLFGLDEVTSVLVNHLELSQPCSFLGVSFADKLDILIDLRFVFVVQQRMAQTFHAVVD